MKVIPLLEAKGHKVAALDLPSCGNDKTVLERITLADDVKKVTDVANAQSGKMILVGHSSGGVVISQAAEILGSEKNISFGNFLILKPKKYGLQTEILVLVGYFF